MEFEQNKKLLAVHGGTVPFSAFTINEKSLVKCKYIFFFSDGLKFLVWWETLN